MKLLLGLLGFLGLAALGLPLLVVAVVATHPWLAAGMVIGNTQVHDNRTDAEKPRVPLAQLPVTVVQEQFPWSVVQLAEQWLGVPYLFGGCSTNGVDCSCLVMRVYQSLGVHLPRTAAEQYTATSRLSRDEVLPGDLVFFANTYMPGISHVGIYIGGGRQINAPTEGQTVSIQPVFGGYWGAHYAGAGRPAKR